jgi:predicted aspartyl protease
MKNTKCKKILIRLAAFYFILAGFCQTVDAQSEVRFRLAHDTVIVVSLMANDQGPFDFVLDTGTDTSVVDPSVARQLSLAPLGQIELNTMSGVQTLTRSSLRTLAVGPAHVENVEVLVQDLAELRNVDSHIRGIVGQNFLSHFNYLLDYRKHSLRIELAHEVRDAIDGESVPMDRRENMMIVPSEAQSRGNAKLRLLLDSGANLVVLTRKSSQGLDRAAQGNWIETTSSGQQGMQVGHVRALTVGSQKFHDIAVALPEAQAADEERVEDGLLPTALFNSLYVNNQDGFLMFNPRVKKN